MQVVFGALVVEAMGHLMTNHDADAAKVYRRVLRVVIERRLQNAGREVDVVLRRVVVGVHRWRRHSPFRRVNRLAELVQVAFALEVLGALHVVQQVIPFHDDAGVVPPVRRITDLVSDGVEFLARLGLGRVAHPGQRLQVGGHRGLESMHQVLHVGLGVGREVLLYPILSDGLAERAVGKPCAPLPARLFFLLALQGCGEEGEVLVLKRLREQRSARVQGMPA